MVQLARACLMKFAKYHALGNDYIVIDPADAGEPPTKNQIIGICHRNYGIGSDGILFGPFPKENHDFSLRIFNPDGSEAEKSGNGLRIFSRYLYDKGLVIQEEPFTILTESGPVISEIYDKGRKISVEMGTVRFDSTSIPVAGPAREVINETLEVKGETLTYCAATIGNPHCIILDENLSREKTCHLGPDIETEARFPNRTNVQFMKILDRNNIQLEIWERGAGYTLASGSSGSAAAAVAHKLGLCDTDISVHMPGGRLEIKISNDFSISMTGPVTPVCEGVINQEMFDS